MGLRPLDHPLHAEIEAKLNSGSFDDAQRLLAKLGGGSEHEHATTYFATRILYQRGKLDLPGVAARLRELLDVCGEFPEARAMLGAATRGSLPVDPLGFRAATFPPGAGDPTPSSTGRAPGPPRLRTPTAMGIPRAPLLPHFVEPDNPGPRHAAGPSGARKLLPLTLHLDLDLELPTLEVLPANGGEEPRSARHARTLPAPGRSDRDSARRSTPPSQLPPAPRATPLTPSIGGDAAAAAASLEASLRRRVPSPLPMIEPPSVFVIATWLSERDFERALEAITALGAESSPELSLLEVRALLGLGRKPAARRSLERFCLAPLMDPDLRAAAARLLIELREIERAETQARRAHAEDPDSELTRITLAWSIVRSDGFRLAARSIAELERLLSTIDPELCPLSALAHALRATWLLGAGRLESARALAERALKMDPAAVDVLAAVAIARQRTGSREAAERAYAELLERDRHLADEVSIALRELGLPVARAPSEPASAGRESVAWGEAEALLLRGDRRRAVERFEAELWGRLDLVMNGAGPSELGFAATVLARYLTEAPVARHFAPYDFSLFSVARLDAALGLLYSVGGPEPDPARRSRTLFGLGAYVGECLRQAYAGEWVGETRDLLRLHVEGQGLCFRPFRELSARIEGGQPLHVAENSSHHPGADPFGQRITHSIAPPSPWDPAPWPTPASLPALGARFADSVVGAYCERSGQRLDGSLASLRGLDRYLTLLSPALAPPDPQAGWVRRAAVLAGAYFGQTLEAAGGARWNAEVSGELGIASYTLTLPSGQRVAPVLLAFERLSNKSLTPLAEQAERILS